jgi:hypothetical protein
MDPAENHRAVAQEIISFGKQRGIDLEQLCTEGAFQKDRRWIYLWRKDELPWSGPANEPLGTLHYNMQGAIAELPYGLKGSTSAFQGVWSEAGTLESIERAFEFVTAWLINSNEIAHLPQRQTRRCEFGRT